MIIVTKRKMKKMKTEMIVAAGTGIAAGATGITLATVSLVKESKFEKKTTEDMMNVQNHISAIEQSCTKACKAIVNIQDALFENGIIKRK